MFGLFSNKTKKIEEKLSKLAIEIAVIQKNIITYQSENNYKNLHISKTKELNSLYNELEAAKGKDYLNDFIRKLSGNLELNIQYEGRKSETSNMVNIGRASVRAIF